MTRMEQAAPMEATAGPAVGGGEALQRIEPTLAEVKDARATSNDTAQSTVDQKFGAPEIEGLSANSGKPGDGTSTDAIQPEQKQLSQQDLEVAASFGHLGQTLTNAGVDINDQKAVDAYLGKSFDNHVTLGLRLAGVPLPDKPTDADLGVAIKPFVAKSNETELLAALKRDPASGFASTREKSVAMLNGYLKEERIQPHKQ